MARRFFFSLLILTFLGFAAAPPLVTAQDDTPLHFLELVWSPDGTHLAFTVSIDEGSHIATYDFATGEINILTGEMSGYQNGPLWSPDSQLIAFSASIETETGSSAKLWIMNRDGTNARVLAEGLTDGLAPADFSPDSQTLYAIGSVLDIAAGIYEVKLWALDVANENHTPIDLAVDDTPVGLALSPDGTTLAVHTLNSSGEGAVWVAPLDNLENARVLVWATEYLTDLAWSPDGTSLLYWALRSGIISRVDGETGTRMTFNKLPNSTSSPRWAPDGRHFGFIMEANEATFRPIIWVIEPDGEDLTELSADVPGGHSYFTWSPDSAALAFIAYGDGQGVANIWLIQADGSNPINLTEAASAD